MTSEQRMAALATANERRAKAANVKRQLAKQPSRSESLALLADMLEQGHSALEPVRVDKAVGACRQCAGSTVRKVLLEARVWPARPRVSELTGRARLELVLALRGAAVRASSRARRAA